jgi:hypothetical protein
VLVDALAGPCSCDAPTGVDLIGPATDEAESGFFQFAR